jgi:hypothetical protein
MHTEIFRKTQSLKPEQALSLLRWVPFDIACKNVLMKHCVLLFFLALFTRSLSADTLTLVADATFEGTSTLHDFAGQGTSSPTQATWTPLTDGGGILSAKDIKFAVKSLSTDHSKRDRNMMKMFDPATHPLITGEIKEWRLGDEAESEQTFTLHINGKTLAVPATLTLFQTEGGDISFTCTFSLSLKAAGLKRPSVLGMIRVGDEVTLTVETTLTPPGEHQLP